MTLIPPGRGLEYRTLQIPLDRDNTKPDPEKRENFLTVDQDGHYLLRLAYFKNSSTVGACDVPLPTQPRIVNIIDLWIKSYRTVMPVLQGQSHNFCFMQSTGLQFTNASQWCNQLVSVFQPRLPNNARVSVNVLRKSFLTETWGSAATMEQRESTASAMRHSLSSKSYNAATSRDHVETAVQRASQIWHDSESQWSSSISNSGSQAPSLEPSRQSARLLLNLTEPKERIELSSVDSEESGDACGISGGSSDKNDSKQDDCDGSSSGSDSDGSIGVVEYFSFNGRGSNVVVISISCTGLIKQSRGSQRNNCP